MTPAPTAAAATARAPVAQTGYRCRDCGAIHFPPRTVCRICGGRRFKGQPLTGRGVVHLVLSPAHINPRPIDVRVLVQLDEGVLVPTRLLPSEAVPGQPVIMLSRRERVALRPAAPLFRAAPAPTACAVGPEQRLPVMSCR